MPHQTVPICAPPQQLIRVRADLKCHLCGRVAGAIHSDESPFPKVVHFRRQGSTQLLLVGNWRQLHCSTCGGSLFTEAIETVRVRKEPTAEELFGSDRRRGRPRKNVPSLPPGNAQSVVEARQT